MEYTKTNMYTGNGDGGETRTYNNRPVRKSAPLMRLMGQLDHLQSTLGHAVSIMDVGVFELEYTKANEERVIARYIFAIVASLIGACFFGLAAPLTMLAVWLAYDYLFGDHHRKDRIHVAVHLQYIIRDIYHIMGDVGKLDDLSYVRNQQKQTLDIPTTSKTNTLYPYNFKQLEKFIERFDISDKRPLKSFIWPVGCKEMTAINMCRTQCRIAEEVFDEVFGDSTNETVADIRKYLNRLSSALFVMSRYINNECGREMKMH